MELSVLHIEALYWLWNCTTKNIEQYERNKYNRTMKWLYFIIVVNSMKKSNKKNVSIVTTQLEEVLTTQIYTITLWEH